MHRKSLATLAILFLFVPAWASAEEPLPEHPGVVSGVLENGVEYRVLRNGTPPGRVTLRLHVGVGSLYESDDERGYAHLLEHMAFQGSENIPDEEVDPFFESLGMSRGRHQNAFTTFDRTVYSLELPDTGDATLRSGLTFLADVLARLDLTEKGLEQERAVVLAERRSGLGPGERMLAQWAPRLWAGARTAERLPIGTEASIARAQLGGVAGFYERWYEPGNAAVVLVGDLPEDRAVELIAETFGDLEAGQEVAEPEVGRIRYEAPFAVVAADPEFTGARVVLSVAGPPRGRETSVEDFRAGLVRTLGTMAFSRRLHEKIAGGEVAYRGGGAGIADHFGAASMAEAQVSGDAEDWRTMLDQLVVELSRARAHGFSEREIDDAKRAMLANARRFERAGPSLPSPIYAQVLLQGIQNGTPIASPAQHADLLERLLPTIDPTEVSGRFAEAYEPTAFAVMVHIEDGDHRPDDSEVLTSAMNALGLEVRVEGETARAERLMETLPAPGVVADEAVADPGGVYSAWFANGVRFHHRDMDYRKDQVGIGITLAGGRIEEGPGTYGFTDAAFGGLRRYATDRLSSTEIRNLFIGKSLRIGHSVDDDMISISIGGPPDEIEFGMRLVHLLLTEPRIEPVAFEQWARSIEQMEEAMRHDVGARAAEILRDFRYPAADRRWDRVRASDLERLELAAVQAWLKDLFARAPIEMSIVGDIDRETARAMALRYFGSLPVRERIRLSLFDERRQVDHPVEPLDVVESIETSTPKAAVFVGFPGADYDATDDVRALVQAAQVIGSRMTRRIREAEGLSYDVGARHNAGRALPGFGLFASGSNADPADATRLADLIAEEFRAFAESGPTEDEVETAFRQFDNGYDETARDPGYWMRMLAQDEFRGRDGVDPARTVAGYRRVTGERMHEVFKRYYETGPTMRIVVTPAQPR